MDNTNNKDKNKVFLLKTTLFGKIITSFIIIIIYKLPNRYLFIATEGIKKMHRRGRPACLTERRTQTKVIKDSSTASGPPPLTEEE